MKRINIKLKYYLALMLLPVFVALNTGSTLRAQDSMEEAKQMLKQMKNGVLLVRLNRESNKLKALYEAGKAERAKKLERNIYDEHREILLSFKKTFDFCPYYFFYGTASDSVRKGKFEGVLFDVERNPVETKAIPEHIFTGEFAETPNLNIDGFIIMNQNMVPLQAPFPFYQRQHGFLGFISRSKAEVLEDLNSKLKDYYQSWWGDNE